MGHFIWDWVWLGGELTCSAFFTGTSKKKNGHALLGCFFFLPFFFYGVLLFFSVIHIISFVLTNDRFASVYGSVGFMLNEVFLFQALFPFLFLCFKIDLCTLLLDDK